MNIKERAVMKIKFPDDTFINNLKCPVCASAFHMMDESGAILKCMGQKTHCYDLSKEGYVNLMPPRGAGGGDSKNAVASRRDFLSQGYYEPVANAVISVLNKYIDGGLVVDAGCGEGYYSNIIADNGFSVIGVDISKFAVQAAAKRGMRSAQNNRFFCVGSVFSLPINDGSAAAVTNIFAPCCEEEFSRVIMNDGIIVVAYAGPDHLMGLKQTIYDNVRQNDGRRDLPANTTLVDAERVKYDIIVDGNENIKNLFAMTPYYWKTSVSDVEKLNNIDKLTTTVDVIVEVYKK